jgi:hypothetical protein
LFFEQEKAPDKSTPRKKNDMTFIVLERITDLYLPI